LPGGLFEEFLVHRLCRVEVGLQHASECCLILCDRFAFAPREQLERLLVTDGKRYRLSFVLEGFALDSLRARVLISSLLDDRF